MDLETEDLEMVSELEVGFVSGRMVICGHDHALLMLQNPVAMVEVGIQALVTGVVIQANLGNLGPGKEVVAQANVGPGNYLVPA